MSASINNNIPFSEYFEHSQDCIVNTRDTKANIPVKTPIGLQTTLHTDVIEVTYKAKETHHHSNFMMLAHIVTYFALAFFSLGTVFLFNASTNFMNSLLEPTYDTFVEKKVHVLHLEDESDDDSVASSDSDETASVASSVQSGYLGGEEAFTDSEVESVAESEDSYDGDVEDSTTDRRAKSTPLHVDELQEHRIEQLLMTEEERAAKHRFTVNLVRRSLQLMEKEAVHSPRTTPSSETFDAASQPGVRVLSDHSSVDSGGELAQYGLDMLSQAGDLPVYEEEWGTPPLAEGSQASNESTFLADRTLSTPPPSFTVDSVVIGKFPALASPISQTSSVGRGLTLADLASVDPLA